MIDELIKIKVLYNKFILCIYINTKADVTK